MLFHGTVAELLDSEVDIDVVDDVTEELCVAFCGKAALTDAGRERFKDALDLPVQIDISGANAVAIILLNDRDDWERMLRLVSDLFYSLAGFCSDWEKWFRVVL